MHVLSGVRCAVLLGLVVAGCSTVRVRVPVMRPAEINLRGKGELVLGEIDGEDAAPLASMLKDAIAASGRFKLIDRTHLDRVLQELSLSQSDLADTESRKKLGKLLTASILLMGHIEESGYRETVDKREEKCSKQDQKTKKMVEYACVRHIRQGTARVAAAFDLIDIETGENLKPKRLACDRKVVNEEVDNPPARIDGHGLKDECHHQVVDEFMRAIAPWQDTVEAPFLVDGDVPMLEVGVGYAQRGAWTEAIERFKAAVEFVGSQPGMAAEVIAKAHWDLGLAYEYTFAFELAEQEVKRAYDMSGDQDFLAELDNIKRLRADREKLAEQTGASDAAVAP